MIRGPVVRRRPLLRAAAVGGTFAAGRAMGRRAEQRDYAESYQDQQTGQAAPPPASQPQAAGPAANSAVLDQLNQLTAMHQQGALTDDEFAAAKAKVLGG